MKLIVSLLDFGPRFDKSVSERCPAPGVCRQCCKRHTPFCWPFGESPLTDSNRRPPPYHGGALPTELRGRDVTGYQGPETAVLTRYRPCLLGAYGAASREPCCERSYGLWFTFGRRRLAAARRPRVPREAQPVRTRGLAGFACPPVQVAPRAERGSLPRSHSEHSRGAAKGGGLRGNHGFPRT